MDVKRAVLVAGAIFALMPASTAAAEWECKTGPPAPSADVTSRCSALGTSSVCGSTAIVAQTAELPAQVCYQVATPGGPMNSGNR